MKIILINPNLVVQKNDPFTTGIVYMPVMLAYAAAVLERAGFDVEVIDAFAEKPKQAGKSGKFWFFGLSEEEILERIPDDVSLVIVYAINLMSHVPCVNIVRALRGRKDQLPIAVLENSQAVTAYALDQVAEEFYDAGADFILTGESEESIVDFAEGLQNNAGQEHFSRIEGVGFQGHQPNRPCVSDLDELEFPAWQKFPLEKYWQLGFAHGPLSEKKYLPLMTSRGCPFSCRFCVTPTISGEKWRSRSAKNVVDEMEYMSATFGVREFHIEDLNPTVSDQRIHEMCEEIIDRELDVIWKIVSGTKVETILSRDTIKVMAQAGCRYISVSPESGSPDVLKKMNKPFNFLHAQEMVDQMGQSGIYSQACFVLGFPGESARDLRMTWDLVREWTRKGLDEIALFMMTPVPGSAAYAWIQGYSSLSELNFTPSWRKDYKELNRFRLKLYLCFLFWKLWYHPVKFFRHLVHFCSRRFMLKMEMVPFRAMKLTWWSLCRKKTLAR